MFFCYVFYDAALLLASLQVLASEIFFFPFGQKKKEKTGSGWEHSRLVLSCLKGTCAQRRRVIAISCSSHRIFKQQREEKKLIKEVALMKYSPTQHNNNRAPTKLYYLFFLLFIAL